MNRTTAIVAAGILLIVAMLGAWLIFSHVQHAKPAEQIPVHVATTTDATTTSPVTSTPLGTVHAYGTITLKVGESARFANLTITPVQVTEDSRCPNDVQCIQAGTVRVSMRINAAAGQSTQTLTLNQPFTTEAETITLTSVTPAKNSKTTIGTADYRLTFDVEKRTVSKQCYIGGCSSEVCSDTPGAVSTCIYREAFGCYKTATCERQASGKCGWTQTKELNTCLANAA